MSAAREVLAEDAGAPVSEIADRAGVSRATFYRHFGSRASLLESVALEPRPAGGSESRAEGNARHDEPRRALDGGLAASRWCRPGNRTDRGREGGVARRLSKVFASRRFGRCHEQARRTRRSCCPSLASRRRGWRGAVGLMRPYSRGHAGSGPALEAMRPVLATSASSRSTSLAHCRGAYSTDALFLRCRQRGPEFFHSERPAIGASHAADGSEAPSTSCAAPGRDQRGCSKQVTGGPTRPVAAAVEAIARRKRFGASTRLRDRPRARAGPDHGMLARTVRQTRSSECEGLARATGGEARVLGTKTPGLLAQTATAPGRGITELSVGGTSLLRSARRPRRPRRHDRVMTGGDGGAREPALQLSAACAALRSRHARQRD